MMRGGERLDFDDTREVSRETQQELGSKVLDALNNEPERKKVDAAEMAALNEAVFERVDILGILEKTTKVAEKMDLKVLSELREDVKRNPEIGAEMTKRYFAEVLDLSLEPHLDTREFLGEKTLGTCMNGGKYADEIGLDIEQHEGDVDGIIGTLAHECWHSYQYDVMRRAGSDKESEWESAEELEQLAMLYRYNDENYIRSSVDYAGYRGQLLEIEAETFRVMVKMQFDKIDAEEKRREEFFASHPEVYGEGNLEGIEREVDGVLHGFDVDEFLGKVGVGKVDELWDVGGDEGFAVRYAGALSELVGPRRPVEVEFVEKVGGDSGGVELDYDGAKMMVERGRLDSVNLLSSLPSFAWEMRQREMVKDELESERAKLYTVNYEMPVEDDEAHHEMYRRQLLVRERDYFVEGLVSIFDEQATIEEIGKMSPEEQAAVREEAERVGWRPVASEKYEIKRS